MKLLVTAAILFSLFSCNQSNKSENKDPKEAKSNSASSEQRKIMDSLARFKPMRLTIDSMRSDLDELIPVGYNDNGSFAYFINENTGGAGRVNFHISTVYEVFSLHSGFDIDEDLDTVLSTHASFIYQSLLSGKIRLTNQFRKLSTDSMGVQYGFKFQDKKTYGPADPDDGSGRKLLSSVVISYRRYDEPTYDVVNKHIHPFESIYDIYVSDCIAIPHRDGDLGYLVVVTEARGFEGYTRKSIELVPIGVLETKE